MQPCIHHNLGKTPTWNSAQHTQPNHDLVPHPCDFAMLHHGSIMLCHKGLEGIKEIQNAFG